VKRKIPRVLLMLLVLVLVAAACGGDDDDGDTTTSAGAATTAAPGTTAAPATTAAPGTTAAAGGEVTLGPGVTAEPCPEGDPARGCIYLAALTDESGPFAAASPGLITGQQLFWQNVNATGGIGGAYDVALPDANVLDAQYTPDQMVVQYNSVAGDIAALAMSLGTPQTLAVLEDYNRDNTVAAPMSWYSGWAFDSVDQGLVMEFGTNYCFEAMNAVDWSMGALPAAGREAPTTVGILAFPTDYGLDYARGVEIAAEANGLEVAYNAPVVPIVAGGDAQQTEAVAQVLGTPADVVYLAVGPSEAGAIVGGAAAQGFTGLFIGSSPSWNPGLLASPAAPAFEAGIFYQSSFSPPLDYDSEGHQALRDALEAAGVTEGFNDFYGAGWLSQYGLRAALEAAVAAGDLTHEGIRTAAATVTDVDYQGMVSNRSFEGEPNDVFPRDSVVNGVNPEALTGVSVVQDFFVGPTAEAYDFSAPCVALGE
jgi:ABC-type branched-subunit amino acid transport system substrate-binding protein